MQSDILKVPHVQIWRICASTLLKYLHNLRVHADASAPLKLQQNGTIQNLFIVIITIGYNIYGSVNGVLVHAIGASGWNLE